MDTIFKIGYQAAKDAYEKKSIKFSGCYFTKKEYDYICTKQRNNNMKYKRILLKLSEALMVTDNGIDPAD
jgi:hypothetical protein